MSWAGPVTGDPAGTEIPLSGGAYSVNNAPAGLYTITITDANGCVATTTTTIIEPVVLTATSANTGALCNGSSDGTVTGTATGGTSPYDMSWTGPNTGNPAGTEINADGGSYTVNGAPSGAYTLTMTDANGCTATTITNLAQPLPISVSATNTPALCNGSADGTITVTATDGSAGYNVSWSGPSNDDPIGVEITNSGGNYTITGLNPGAFTITITDLNGCTATTTSTITQPVSLTASATNTAALCNGSADGTITVTATNGTPAYNVSWSGPVNGDPAGTEIGTSGGNYTITGASAGTYTVTVTDLNGCTATATSTITEPVVLTATATNTSVLCNGGATGSVTGTSTGGTAPYDMSWIGPNTGNPAGTEIGNDGGSYTVNGAPAGLYTITITDANGCIATAISTVIEPTLLSASATNTSVLCNGGSDGSVTGTATGGTSPYDMSWTGPNTGNPAGTEITTDGGSYAVNGAPAGLYTITMTDANGCIATTTTNVIEPNALSVILNSIPPQCNGATDGSIDVQAFGGTSGYDVSWSGSSIGDPSGIEIISNSGNYPITNLPSGNYTVSVLDANGCILATSATLIPPAALTITTLVNDVQCSGVNSGSIQVIANNGTPGYNVSWTGSSVGDPIGTEISMSGGSYNMTSLGAGTYLVTLTDNNGCFDSISVSVNEPLPLSIQPITTPTLCQSSLDGEVTLTVSGGTPAYNLTINSGPLTNPSGDEITASGGSYTFSNLGAGNYIVTITDDNNCSVNEPITIQAGNINPSVTVIGDTICLGQSTQLSVTATPSGGTFLWNNGTSNSTLNVSPIVTTQYSVLYNYSGCFSQGSAFVVVNPIPTVSVNSQTICLGETGTLLATPSLPGGNYAWSNNLTDQSINVSPSSTTNYSVIYTLNGCSSQSSTGIITVNPIPQLSIASSTICDGETASVIATPSLPGGTIEWSPTGETTLSIDVSPNVTSSFSAIYTLNGCESNSASGTVTVNPIPVVNFSSNLSEGCAPLNVELYNSSINANLASSVSWSIDGGIIGSNDTMNYTLPAGCHDVTLSMTLNGCVGTTTINDFICVEEIPQAILSANINSFNEPSQNVIFYNGSIGATNYVWNTGDGNIFNSSTLEHLYTNTGSGYTIWLTAISNLGCVDSASITIPYEDDIIFYIPNTFTPDGNNFNQVFQPIFSMGIDENTFDMTIFNRWGEVVFQSLNPNEGWDGSFGMDGRDVEDGVYIYKIKYKIPQEDDYRICVGHVNLIR